MSCSDGINEPAHNVMTTINIPRGFPEIDFPEDNHFTKVRWELGKKLFYDTRLSADSTKSCASCHNPELAFADDKALSFGVKNREGTRNAPSLANAAYLPYFTREGGVPTLEMQVLVPIQEHNEFDFNIVDIASRLQPEDDYRRLSLKAYGRELDYYVITRAIANFERSLISGSSSYDKYSYKNDKSALTQEQQKGMELFFSDRTSCSSCHSGFNFTDNSFKNNGLYENYSDPGRNRLTNIDEDIALFKVPSLRNAVITAPYMHDGSISTLEEVVEHYNSGGKNHMHKSKLIRKLNLSAEERSYLVSFLESLTDYEFINNKSFRNN